MYVHASVGFSTVHGNYGWRMCEATSKSLSRQCKLRSLSIRFCSETFPNLRRFRPPSCYQEVGLVCLVNAFQNS